MPHPETRRDLAAKAANYFEKSAERSSTQRREGAKTLPNPQVLRVQGGLVGLVSAAAETQFRVPDHLVLRANEAKAFTGL